MNVKIKKLSPNAVVPVYTRAGDCGLDLTATSMKETDMYIEYGTGLAMQIPEGYVGLIYPRSSLSNYDLVLSNHVGVIDSNYTGEIKFRFKRSENFLLSANPIRYKVGDRIGQIIIQKIPHITFTEVEELEETNRGAAGYGSSGD